MENEKRLPVIAILIGGSYLLWPLLMIFSLAVIYGFRLDQGDPLIVHKALALMGVGCLLSLSTWRLLYAGRENNVTQTACYYSPRALFWYRVRVLLCAAIAILSNVREFFSHSGWYQWLDDSGFFFWAHLLVLLDMGEFLVRLLRQWHQALQGPKKNPEVT